MASQLNQLSPEQRQIVLARAQQEANQQVMQGTFFFSVQCGGVTTGAGVHASLLLLFF